MLEVEGYKMFRGKMLVTPLTNFHAPFILEGDFLYKPEYGCWYHDGHSYGDNICCIKKDITVSEEE